MKPRMAEGGHDPLCNLGGFECSCAPDDPLCWLNDESACDCALIRAVEDRFIASVESHAHLAELGMLIRVRERLSALPDRFGERMLRRDVFRVLDEIESELST